MNYFAKKFFVNYYFVRMMMMTMMMMMTRVSVAVGDGSHEGRVERGPCRTGEWYSASNLDWNGCYDDVCCWYCCLGWHAKYSFWVLGWRRNYDYSHYGCWKWKVRKCENGKMMDGSGVVDLDSPHRFLHLHLRNRLVSFVLVFDGDVKMMKKKNAKVVVDQI